MKMTPGFGDISGKIVSLNKSLYGFEQAACSWHNLLIVTRKQNGFDQHLSEPCMLRLIDSKTGRVKLVVAVC